MNLSPLAANAIIAVIALLLYAFVWWATSSLPRTAKVLARLVLAIVAFSPIVLASLGGRITLFNQLDQIASAPPPHQAERAAEERARQMEPPPAQRPEPGSGGAQPSPARTPPPVASAPPPPPVASAPPPAPVPPQPPGSPAAPITSTSPSPPVVVMAPPPPAPSPPKSGGVRSPAPAAADEPSPATEAKKTTGPFGSGEAWDIVPVFYGTDRQQSATPSRIDYGSDRGKQLRLGQALVTIPKSHEVPQVERPWVYRVPFTAIELYREPEDPNRHFTMKDIKELTREQLIALVQKRLESSHDYKDHALIFVHGFNTSFDNAVYRTAQIAYDLKFDGAPFVYSWPSKGTLGFQDYSYDRESAGQAEPYLRDFLELVARETGAKSISVIAHSMGNQLLLPVLRDLKRMAPPGVQISQVILAAPDVDRDNFEFLAKEIQGVSRGVTMFSAANDWALNASKRFWGGVPRAGDVPPDGPLVVPGLDTIDVTAINTDLLSLNHSGYAEKTAILNDIQLLIQTGERPPEKRIPILQKVDTARGAYWRYPATR
jgi:esterase/lipase superfamily enzyme